jgi:Fic family protein
VSEIVEGTSKLPPSKEYLGREVQNILTVCHEVLSDLGEGKGLKLSIGRIKELNGRVLEGLAVEDWVVPGEISTRPVVVGRYRGAPRQDCEYLLARLCEWLSDPSFADEEHLGLGAPILKAIIAHLYIAFIHPFGDGNGRTARLIEFQILVASGIPSPAAHLLSNHYNETRTEYYRQLDMARKGPLMFILYALQGFVDGLRAQLDLIHEQQLDVAWENFVHQTFRDRSSPADVRRRHLVLDLSRNGEPVPRSRLRRLTPRLAEAYAGMTDKALTRDINALQKLGLFRRVPEGWAANKERILAFLPIAMPEEGGNVGPDLRLPLIPSE